MRPGDKPVGGVWGVERRSLPPQLLRPRAPAKLADLSRHRVKRGGLGVVERGSQAGLSRAAAPSLGQGRCGDHDRFAVERGGLEEGPQPAIVPFQRDQGAGVEDHGGYRRRSCRRAVRTSRSVMRPCSASH